MSALDIRHRQGYMPSLLDRLLDETPERSGEPPDRHAPDGERMRRIIQRDLNRLLNATNLDAELDLVPYPSVAASVVNYGIPALPGNYLTGRDWETVERMVRTAIVRFEPRLIPDSLRIQPLHDEEPIRYNQLVFEIRALMHWFPRPLEFHIQSAFDIEMNHTTLGPQNYWGS